MMRALDVWWAGRFVGQLTQDQYDELGFSYTNDWLEDNDALALSASLPAAHTRRSRARAAKLGAARDESDPKLKS
jgi:serine/threonine-protein kinase HipA